MAAATLRAIDKPKPEMVVSVGPGRALKALMDYFPGLGPGLNRLSGADKLMTAIADYREAARTDPAPAAGTPADASPSLSPPTSGSMDGP